MAGRVLRDSRGRYAGSTGGFGRGRKGRGGGNPPRFKGPKLKINNKRVPLTPTEAAFRRKTTAIGAGLGTAVLPGLGTAVGAGLGRRSANRTLRSSIRSGSTIVRVRQARRR